MSRKLSSTKEGSVESTFEAKPYTGKTAFEQWVEYEGIPMIRDFIVPDLNSLALKSWDRVGSAGSWLVLGAPEDQLSMAAYVCEIGAGKSTKPQRHLFEELIFVLSGSGATTVWNDGAKSASFEWKRGSLFSPPLNVWHQHFNGSGSELVRYVAMTNAPAVFNMFHSYDFIMNNPYRFKERFDNEQEYFSGKGETHPGDVWESNFIPDIVDLPFYEFSTKGPGMKHVEIELSSNTLSGHISESPVGVYKKAHRHGPGATLQRLGNGAGALRRGRPTHSHRCVREKNRFAAEAERHCFGHARIKGWRRFHEGEQSGVDSGDTENIEAERQTGGRKVL